MHTKFEALKVISTLVNFFSSSFKQSTHVSCPQTGLGIVHKAFFLIFQNLYMLGYLPYLQLGKNTITFVNFKVQKFLHMVNRLITNFFTDFFNCSHLLRYQYYLTSKVRFNMIFQMSVELTEFLMTLYTLLKTYRKKFRKFLPLMCLEIPTA